MNGVTSVTPVVVSFAGGVLKFKITAEIDPPNGVEMSPTATGAYSVDTWQDTGVNMNRIGTSNDYESDVIELDPVPLGATITCDVDYEAQYQASGSGNHVLPD